VSESPFIDDEVLDGGVAYVVDITFPGVGEGDLVLGGAGDDWIFAGPGDDIVNGGPGDNIIWGGDGHDIIWGDVGDDRIYGGNGDNVIDVKESSFRAGLTTSIEDVAWWDLAWYVAPEVDTDGNVATDNGSDIIYGGRGRDIMQADLGAGGPAPGDRLMDWYGSFNLYLVCEGPYGAGRILREPSPNIVEVLLQLAEADGAYDVRTTDSSGWKQLALAVDEHARANRGSAHPDHPGNDAGC
jgi:Ca2+-binding RTX toxin-like protein